MPSYPLSPPPRSDDDSLARWLDKLHKRITGTSADGGMGYASGTGGTVTQLTSKSTAVALNKLCGQITMHNAALAAGARVSFVVTNSTVGASDVAEGGDRLREERRTPTPRL
jgi:hypothetical protein